MFDLRLHIWRYEPDTPTEESPWIVTHQINGQATWDPPCFPTWTEAVEYASDRKAVDEYVDAYLTNPPIL